MRNKKNQNTLKSGFTLIELLVVIAIIALLSSVALISLMSARQKARDVKRLSDMTQMMNALELYYSFNKGYPSAPVAGIPSGLVPNYASSLPRAPQPPDGGCEQLTYDPPVPAGTYATGYYYYPSGQSYQLNGLTLYPEFGYYFCLGDNTGNFNPGKRVVTSKGVR